MDTILNTQDDNLCNLPSISLTALWDMLVEAQQLAPQEPQLSHASDAVCYDESSQYL